MGETGPAGAGYKWEEPGQLLYWRTFAKSQVAKGLLTACNESAAVGGGDSKGYEECSRINNNRKYTSEVNLSEVVDEGGWVV